MFPRTSRQRLAISRMLYSVAPLGLCLWSLTFLLQASDQAMGNVPRGQSQEVGCKERDFVFFCSRRELLQWPLQVKPCDRECIGVKAEIAAPPAGTLTDSLNELCLVASYVLAVRPHGLKLLGSRAGGTVAGPTVS